jgi:membrane protease subunit (stomatin/prohibitin family)
MPERYTVEDIRERLMDSIEPAMVSAIASEGKDMYNLQANGREISAHVIQDLSPELETLGFKLVNFTIRQVSYPKEVQDRINQNAGINMFGDVSKFQQVAMADGLQNGNNAGSNIAGTMMGMAMAGQMMQNMQQPVQQQTTQQASPNGTVPKFCPECGTPTNGAKFCSNCGTKLA